MSDEGARGELEALGYRQELKRDVSAFQNFALSFSVISVLTGAVTLYPHGLRWGGPLAMTVGWPLVVAGTLCVALSLAELASAYPTAGALYHWASILGGRGAGWATAWLNTVGQFAITAGIDYGLSEFLAPLLGWPADAAHVVPLFVVVLASHALLNHVGVGVVARLNVVSAWYHLVGVAVVVGAVLALAPQQPLNFLLETVPPPPGAWTPGFVVALLQAAWTFTGYDASAHASEETHDAARNAPRGILTAVGASAIAGWALILGVTLAIPSLPDAVAAPNAFLFILQASLGRGVGVALVWVCVGAMWFCGLASVTSNSRMLWAFARDGGLPASALLARVSPRFSTPHVATWVSAVCALGVVLLSIGIGEVSERAAADALGTVTAVSTVALYASYGVPIAAALWARRHGWTRRGPFTVKAAGPWLNGLALGWIVASSAVMSLPPSGVVGAAMALIALALVVAWFAGVRGRFKGPAALPR
ncbi:MAG: amino acid permease [Myxococcaceae bacterium]|jgi:amino acid transporter|nr:amino acid permease [Myxococcaceae bacterium]